MSPWTCIYRSPIAQISRSLDQSYQESWFFRGNLLSSQKGKLFSSYLLKRTSNSDFSLQIHEAEVAFLKSTFLSNGVFNGNSWGVGCKSRLWSEIVGYQIEEHSTISKKCDLLCSVMIWINLEPCGLICGMMTWLLLGYGMLATTVSALKQLILKKNSFFSICTKNNHQ